MGGFYAPPPPMPPPTDSRPVDDDPPMDEIRPDELDVVDTGGLLWRLVHGLITLGGHNMENRILKKDGLKAHPSFPKGHVAHMAPWGYQHHVCKSCGFSEKGVRPWHGFPMAYSRGGFGLSSASRTVTELPGVEA